MPISRMKSVDDDYRLRHALLHIQKTYGDVCSVEEKSKQLFKFGRSLSIGTGQRSTVMIQQDTGLPNEVFATGNTIDSLVSADTGDANTVFSVEGHTLDTGTGFTFVSQQITCLGQAAAALSTPMARCNRVYIPALTWPQEARSTTADVYVYDSAEATGITAGVPDVGSATKCMIDGVSVASDAINQSEKCATTISATDYWICTEFYAAVTRGGPQSAKVDIEVEYRVLGGVWRPVGMEMNLDQSSGPFMHDSMDPYVIIPKNAYCCCIEKAAPKDGQRIQFRSIYSTV